MRWLLPLVSTLLLLTPGCSSVQLNPAALFNNCDFVLQRVTPTVVITFPMEKSYVDLDFEIGVKNPNSVTLNFTRLAFDLYINDKYRVFTGTTHYGIALKAHEYSPVHLKSRFSYREFSDLFLTLADIVQSKKVLYTIQGTAYYQTLLGEISFPTTISRQEL